MNKNTMLLFMIVLLVGIGVGFLLQKQMLNTPQVVKVVAEPQNISKEQIGLAEYTSLFVLKDNLEYDFYKKNILPKIEILLAKDIVTKQDFLKFEEEINALLVANGIALKGTLLEGLRKESLKESLKGAVKQFSQDASKMSKEVARGLKGVMEELEKEFNSQEENQPKDNTVVVM